MSELFKMHARVHAHANEIQKKARLRRLILKAFGQLLRQEQKKTGIPTATMLHLVAEALILTRP